MDQTLHTLIFGLAFALVYIRLLLPYIRYFIRYMFNERVGWNRFVERPRLVFYGLGLLLMHFSAHSIIGLLPRSIGVLVVLDWILFLIGFYLCMLTWTKRFKTVFIPRITSRIVGRKNFKIVAAPHQLERVYDGLVRYDMIVFQKTGRGDFVDALTLDWGSHGSLIYFKLDGPSLREFYELFKASFPHNSLNLIDFVTNSDVIRRADGRRYNYDTIRNAVQRTKTSKRSEDLESVFSIFSQNH